MPDIDQSYMQRCLELARLGAGKVAPNPMVGAVLVHNGKIIGEGYHREYGKSHAEVNCIESVSKYDRELLATATMYVSLEPCVHFGKTPPCSDLIIEKGIRKVVIGCPDPFSAVNGRGIDKLQKAGIHVVTGVLEQACKEINRRFFTFHTAQRPYIVLKWAQTANGVMAAQTDERLLISNEYSNRLVHQWRTGEAAILVGTNTALLDNPVLDNRLWTGRKPVRMVLDMDLRLPANLKLFDQQQKTIVFNSIRQEQQGNILYYQLQKTNPIIPQVLNAAYEMEIQSILVEGGARMLQSFMDEGLWDEARVITNETLLLTDGLNAPNIPPSQLIKTQKIVTDTIHYYTHKQINQ